METSKLSRKQSVDVLQSRREFFKKLSSMSKKVSIIFLERESLFEQTYSHYRAIVSGKWHAFEGEIEEENQTRVNTSELDMERFLGLMHQMLVQKNRLKKTIDNIELPTLNLCYRDIVPADRSYLCRVERYTDRVFGICDMPERDIKKITGQQEIKDAWLKFLEKIDIAGA